MATEDITYESMQSNNKQKIDTYYQTPLESKPSLSKILMISIIALLIAILPWVFSNATEEFYDTTKGYLLILSTSLLTMIWGISLIIKKKIRLYRTPFDLPILISLLILVASTIFSINVDTSFWGYHMRIAGGLVSYIVLVLIYYLIVNNIDVKQTIKLLLRLIPFSIGLLALFTIFNTLGLFDYGVSQLISTRPDLQFLESTLFSPIGSTNNLPQLFLIAFPLTLFLLINKKGKSILLTTCGTLIAIALIVASIITSTSSNINYTKVILWLLFALINSISIYYIIKTKNKLNNYKLYINIAILIIVLVSGYIALNLDVKTKLIDSLKSNGVNYSFDRYYEIPQETSTQIIAETIKNNSFKNTLIGSGLDTYAYQFPKYRPISQNSQINWTSNYSTPNTQIEMSIISYGLIGSAIIYLAFSFFTYKFISKKIIANKSSINRKSLISLSIILVVFLISFWIFYQSLLFQFLFTVIFALGVKLFILSNPNEAQRFETQFKLVSSNNPTSNLNLGSYLLGSLLIISGITLIVFSTINLFAEIYYSDGIELSINSEYDNSYDKLLAASKLNPNRDYYHRSIATVALTKLDVIFNNQSDTDLSEDERQQKELAANYLLNLITSEVEKSILLNPENYENWQQSAIIYKRLTEIAQGTKFGNETLQSISEAIRLNPNNPDNYLVLAYLYQFNADEQKRLEAEQIYLKAYELQPAYRQTIIQFGEYLEEIEKYEDALDLYTISRDRVYNFESAMKAFLDKKILELSEISNP